MEIDFENINDELLETEMTVDRAAKALEKSIDLTVFISASEAFEIEDREGAKQCLSMSLQARKMRQGLDKARAQIVRPHFDFQKAVNKLAKAFEEKLEEIEKNLHGKLTHWFKGAEESNLLDLMKEKIEVEDGVATKKITWQFELENPSLVPAEFLSVDEKKIKEAIRGGIRKIPGIRIFENVEIGLRVKN